MTRLTSRRPRALARICCVGVCVILGAQPVSAQPEEAPRRPRLRASADTNDWVEYQNHAMNIIVTNPRDAAAALYWAERLEPLRAEPTYARWAALWMTRPQLLRDYWTGAEKVLKSPDVLRLDSLNYTARLRNPMVNQAARRLVMHAMLDHVAGPGRWQWNRNPEMLAWLDYTNGSFTRAAARLGEVIAKDPEKHYQLRYTRALAFYAMQHLDSAATELDQLIAEMRRRDEKELVYFYDSKAMFEYAAGVTRAEGLRFEEARQAFMRALSEDLAFYPAHRGLAAMSLALGDTSMAIKEYELALELNPDDLVTRYYFGLALMNAGRRDEAIGHLMFVVDAEPYFAAPYYYIGRMLESRGRQADAMRYYGEFIPRAPRSQAPAVAVVQGRLSALAASGITPTPWPGGEQ